MKKNGTGGETHINMVSYGGGVNSTALLIGLHQHRIPVDLILFADTGAEHPHTYAYVDDMSTSNGVSAEYLTELHSFMNGTMVVIIAVVTFVAGIVGALIAKGVFKKHFQKAGIV